MRDYISATNGESLSQFPNEDIIAIGLALIPFEPRDNARLSNEQAFGCLMQALGLSGAVSGMIAEFRSAWSSKIAVRSLVQIIGRMAAVYVGWFMVAWAVKKIW